MVMEKRLLDPATEQFLVAALAYLDDVRTYDEDYWPGVLQALRTVEQGLGRDDPGTASTAVEQLGRVLQSRAIPVGSRPAEPMPEPVREVTAAIRHRLGAAPTGKPQAAAAGPPGADQRRPERDHR